MPRTPTIDDLVSRAVEPPSQLSVLAAPWAACDAGPCAFYAPASFAQFHYSEAPLPPGEWIVRWTSCHVSTTALTLLFTAVIGTLMTAKLRAIQMAESMKPVEQRGSRSGSERLHHPGAGEAEVVLARAAHDDVVEDTHADVLQGLHDLVSGIDVLLGGVRLLSGVRFAVVANMIPEALHWASESKWLRSTGPEGRGRQADGTEPHPAVR